MAPERVEPPGAGLELAVVAAGAAAVVAGMVTAGGAWLSARFSGGRVGGGLADWLRVTVRLVRGESPSAAWGELATGLPSTGAYWACTSAVGLVAVAVVTAAVVMWRRTTTPGRARSAMLTRWDEIPGGDTGDRGGDPVGGE